MRKYMKGNEDTWRYRKVPTKRATCKMLPVGWKTLIGSKLEANWKRTGYFAIDVISNRNFWFESYRSSAKIFYKFSGPVDLPVLFIAIARWNFMTRQSNTQLDPMGTQYWILSIPPLRCWEEIGSLFPEARHRTSASSWESQWEPYRDRITDPCKVISSKLNLNFHLIFI